MDMVGPSNPTSFYGRGRSVWGTQTSAVPPVFMDMVVRLGYSDLRSSTSFCGHGGPFGVLRPPQFHPVFMDLVGPIFYAVLQLCPEYQALC